MRHGGITASLQSVGASGFIKPEAREAIAEQMRRLGMISDRGYLADGGHGQPLVVVEVPSYFASPTPDIPLLMSDYREGGYNHRKAEEMLNESRGFDGRHSIPCDCSMEDDTVFVVHRLHRLENRPVFERFKAYEAQVAEKRRQEQLDPVDMHPWLARLADKNDLSRVANTVYLLHGTDKGNLASICQQGLKSSLSLAKGHLWYGKGLYFTPQSCKAWQYGAVRGCVLLCRVVLGRVQVLEDKCPQRLFPSSEFDSAMAMKGVTRHDGRHDALQVHDEYIIYHDAACYPEFVLEVSVNGPV